MMAADLPLVVTDPELPWDLSRPRESEVALRSLHAAIPGDAPADKARSVNLLTQIARTESMQGKLADAERTLDRAAKVLSSIDDLEPRLRLLLERGRLFALKRTPIQARACFVEVWTVARERGLAFHAVDAAQMMAVVETPKQRSKWIALALDLVDGSTDERVRSWRGQLHIALGSHYEELLQLTKAIECFELAVASFQEKGTAQEEWVARAYAGRAYRLSNRIAEALQIQETVLRELSKSSTYVAMVFEELGECLFALKRAPEAEQYFKRAYDLVSKDDNYAAREPARFKRLKTLAKVK